MKLNIPEDKFFGAIEDLDRDEFLDLLEVYGALTFDADSCIVTAPPGPKTNEKP